MRAEYYQSEAGPERDMISLRDGMGSGWDGKFFRRRRRRRVVVAPPPTHQKKTVSFFWKKKTPEAAAKTTPGFFSENLFFCRFTCVILTVRMSPFKKRRVFAILTIPPARGDDDGDGDGGGGGRISRPSQTPSHHAGISYPIRAQPLTPI